MKEATCKLLKSKSTSFTEIEQTAYEPLKIGTVLWKPHLLDQCFYGNQLPCDEIYAQREIRRGIHQTISKSN